MILTYNWLIINPISSPQQTLDELLPLPDLVKNEQPQNENQSLNSTISPLLLREPFFAIIFSYLIEEPETSQPEIDIVPEISLFDQSVEIKVTDQRRSKNHIYKMINIQKGSCYDAILTLMIKIKYYQKDKYHTVDNLENLIDLIGQRKLSIHDLRTYATIKKEMIIDEPFNLDYRYEPENYVWIKLLRTDDKPAQILSVVLMNWLALSNYQLKKQVFSSTFCQPVWLKKKQAYAVMFILKSSANFVEMPCSITYRLQTNGPTFKMIKILKLGEDPKHQ